MDNEKKRKYNESLEDYEKRLEKDFGEKLSALISIISKKYGLKKEKLGELIQFSSETNLEEFRSEIERQKVSGEIDDNISSEDIQKLYQEISNLKQETEKKIETLANQIEVQQFKNYDGKLISLFPKNMVKRAKSPKTLPDHITGSILGTINTAEIAVTILVDITQGILLTPLHLSQILSGKAEYKANI